MEMYNKSTGAAAGLRLLGAGALNLLYPRRCPFCDEVLGSVPECENCRAELTALRLKDPRLEPGTHYFGKLEGAAAAFRYDGIVRAAILRVKYQGCRWYGRDLGNLLAKELFGCTFWQKYGILLPKRLPVAIRQYDVIVPVPKSSNERGYNVPGLLAAPLSQALDIPVLADALCRSRFARHQAGLPLAERLENVAGAFVAAKDTELAGKRVLLADDVITTGATAAACTAALLAAGAESVYAVALASSQWQEDLPDRENGL